MCHNHSHALVDHMGDREIAGIKMSVFSLRTDFKLELQAGQMWTIPAGAILCVPFLTPEASSVSALLLMEALLGCTLEPVPEQRNDTATPSSRSRTPQ